MHNKRAYSSRFVALEQLSHCYSASEATLKNVLNYIAGINEELLIYQSKTTQAT